jgi:hypothetical protein
MQGLVPGEETLPTYPMTIGFPTGVAKVVEKDPSQSKEKTAKMTTANLAHLSISRPPFNNIFQNCPFQSFLENPYSYNGCPSPAPSNGKNLPLDALNIMENGVRCQQERTTNT